MNDEGQYRYTNGSLINSDIHSDRTVAVANHEMIHNQLYAKTTYGQMILMLEKNSLFDKKSKEFQEILFDFVNRMQERTTVNIENMQVYASEGMEKYYETINELKNKNTAYYNYFRKLCCINGKIKTKYDAESCIKLLYGIAIIALNVNLELIPLDKFSDSESLKKYINNPKYNSLVSPNKRFDILINILFRNNDNNSDIESVIKGGIDIDKINDYSYIHEMAFKNVSKMLSKSQMSERLIERLKTVGIREIAMKAGYEYLAIKPAKINERKVFSIKSVKSEEDLLYLLNAQADKILFVQNSLGGFEDIFVISCYVKDLGKYIRYNYFTRNKESFFRILSKFECKFIFYKTKLIKNYGKSIRKMVKKLPVYLYEESPVLYTVSFIKEFYYGAKFTFIHNKNHIIFIVGKRSMVLYADIIGEAKDVLKKELCDSGLEYVMDGNEIFDINEVIKLDDICNDFSVINIDEVDRR